MNTEKQLKEYNKRTDKKSKVINVRISEKQKNQITDVRNKLNLTQSELLRLAVENIISKYN